MGRRGVVTGGNLARYLVGPHRRFDLGALEAQPGPSNGERDRYHKPDANDDKHGSEWHGSGRPF